MKLPEHVDLLRNMISSAFDKQFSRLGIGSKRKIELEKIPQELHARRKRFEEMFQSHLGETGSYENAREKLLDELTFTLFNRIAAVKVMEAASFFPPIITKQPEHGDRSFGHKVWLEVRPDMRGEELEGIREYILHAFNELGDSLPLYSRSYPYALLPDPINMNEIIDAFNALEKDPQVGENIWQSDDILGWLYESYNNAKKAEFKNSGEKVEYDKVSLQSQVYTPRWVVQFLVDNSLGKMYLEMYPDSEIKQKFKIANAPETQERELKPLHEVKLIDPACGSGNFLLYAFDLFYELYLDQIENYGADYDEENIPQLILQHNLHGIDLDDRAVQLAQLGLYIKARKRRRNIGTLQFKVVSSGFFLPDYEDVRHIFEDGTTLDRNQKALIAEVWSDLQLAYKFGSLIRLDEKIKARLRELVSKREKIETQPKMFSDEGLGIKPKPVQRELFLEGDIKQERIFTENFFQNLKTAVEQYAQKQGSSFLTSKTRDAVSFLELLNTEYDVATANPPYTDSSDYGSELKVFIEDNYKKPHKFHTNLYAAFIKRCYEMADREGKIAMVHPLTFMYIKTFEDVRKFIIEKTHINLFVEWGYLGMFNPSARVDSALYILERNSQQERDAVFIKLNKLYETKRYDALFKAYNKFLTYDNHELLFTIPQSKLKIIKTWPFIYWISDDFREKFKTKSVDDYMTVCKGLTTAHNDRFLRFQWEVNLDNISLDYQIDKKKWVRFSKGGPYNKWYGNLWLVVNWENNGYELRNFKYFKGNQRSVIRNEKYYFKSGITGSFSGSKGITFRRLPKNFITEGAAGGIFFDKSFENIDYALSFLNSKLSFYISNCLNSTVTTEVGDLKRIPFLLSNSDQINLPANLAIRNSEIKKYLCSFSIIEFNYKSNPLTQIDNGNLQNRIKNFLVTEAHLLTQVLINEAIINHEIFEIYELTEHDRTMVLDKEGKSIGNLPVSEEARLAYLADEEETREFPIDNIKDFLKALPITEFASEDREIIESEFPSLYQNNNDLEEFCIRHQVNPINVWYWFKQSNVIPQQRTRTLAMEFLTDMIRELLMEDEDGIIPLASNAGEKILIERIEDKFREKGFSMAQFSQFDSLIGRPLEDYLFKHFFAELSDHLNLFMYLPKTPFIWHLSSGPEQGIDCYIIIYKWSRDKLMRIRSVYLERRERALINRQTDIAGNESADAQNEKEKIRRQLNEIRSFKKKIDELLAEGYDPILDDGVGKNIAPLQRKKMIPYEVLTPGQLKKYLNADW
jgi:hypothetical protein